MSALRARIIKEGDRVEVIKGGPGFEHSYYATQVISLISRGNCRVRYENLVQENKNQTPLEEDVPMIKLRPFPQTIPQWNYYLCELIDGYFNDGLWLGRVVHLEMDRYIVYYEDQNVHVNHKFENVRLHQEWCKGAWMYTKLSADLD